MTFHPNDCYILQISLVVTTYDIHIKKPHKYTWKSVSWYNVRTYARQMVYGLRCPARFPHTFLRETSCHGYIALFSTVETNADNRRSVLVCESVPEDKRLLSTVQMNPKKRTGTMNSVKIRKEKGRIECQKNIRNRNFPTRLCDVYTCDECTYS